VPDRRWFGIDHTAHLVRCGTCGAAVVLGSPQSDHERFHAALDALTGRLAQIAAAVNTPLTRRDQADAEGIHLFVWADPDPGELMEERRAERVALRPGDRYLLGQGRYAIALAPWPTGTD
jgi:hypothetical protein